MTNIEQLLTYLNLDEFINIFLYQLDEEKFKYYTNGKFTETPIPDFIKKYLLNEKVSLYFFRKNKDIITFYFFRIEIQNKRYVLIVQDNREGKYLNKFIATIFDNLIELKNEIVQTNKEIDFLRDELSICEKELATREQEKSRLEETLASKESLIESLEESVNILKKSRQKMLKLIDGFNLPFFSMDLHYDINNVNLAAGKFAGETNLPRLVGGKCFKMIYNLSDKCPWCKIDQIRAEKNCIKQHITIERDGEKYTYEQNMFPIFDQEGNLIEVGEYIHDITEQYQLIDSLRKSEIELSEISKKNIENINEISSLKKAYEELLDAYDKAKTKISKMTNVLNTIMQQDTVNELLRLRAEKKELEIKLSKALTTIKNYAKRYEEQAIKQNETAKKTFYSIERLFNIINNKKRIEDEEIKKVFDFLSGQILYIKNMLEKKEDNNEPKSSN
ncbi:MAG: hypothetical protein N3C60_00700 [Calditerrivibrio sp.]|nr:hypothetical protein [Calditerrivibrio sp.]